MTFSVIMTLVHFHSNSPLTMKYKCNNTGVKSKKIFVENHTCKRNFKVYLPLNSNYAVVQQ